jgi:formylglycine-generating enzyme required for sulfatase activity
MKLQPKLFQQIVNVLLDAFDIDSLNRMMRTHFNTTLYRDVDTNGSLTLVVERLLQWAEERDCVAELLQNAHAINETNRKLAALVVEFDDSYYMTNEEESRTAFSWLHFEPELVKVADGSFVIGCDDVNGSFESPQHEIRIPTYWIGRYPVTNEQYAHFVKDMRYAPPEHTGWFGDNPPDDRIDHPVSCVSWYDAIAYCKWLSAKTENHRKYRLPSEAEWEKAARGADGRKYPWGNEWEPSRCNTGTHATTPVSKFDKGASPYGCFDMAGNVAEWTTTLWGTNWREPDYTYPYRFDDGRDDLDADKSAFRISRGGAYDAAPTRLRCSARGGYTPEQRDKKRGFRVVTILESFNGR